MTSAVCSTAFIALPAVFAILPTSPVSLAALFATAISPAAPSKILPKVDDTLPTFPPIEAKPPANKPPPPVAQPQASSEASVPNVKDIP